MKVTEKKLDDGRILLEAVASTAEVSHALTAAQYRFAQQMGVQPTPGMSVEQAVEKQLGIKDLDASCSSRPWSTSCRSPSTSATSRRRSRLFRGRRSAQARPDLLVRGSRHAEARLRAEVLRAVSITVPPFEIEQAEVEEQIAQIAESYAEFVSDEPHPVEKATASCWRSKLPERREDGQPVHRRPHVPHRHGPHARGLREASHRHERGRNEVVLLRPARHERRRQGRHRRLHRHRQGDAEKGRPRHR